MEMKSSFSPEALLIGEGALQHDISYQESFTSPEELYERLKKAVLEYHPSSDLAVIDKAYQLAKERHKDQKRKSGEPYIIHPICVAIVLAELEMDTDTIVSGILHDIVEDTDTSLEEVEAEFGSEVALLVDGVTKLTQINLNHDKMEIQAENLRKMFVAMAKDIRVIIIKLADRLHNLRTLQYQKPQKQIEKARETLDIYAPIAERLGISKIKIELDELSLRYLHPDVYEEIEKKVSYKKEERIRFIQLRIAEIVKQLEKTGIKANVSGRVKHNFSIYKKMVSQHKEFEQIYDVFAVRIIVDDLKDCYGALGIIHEMYTPIPGRFKDYIAMPKENKYQSLHTTVMGPAGQPFEIQIRTFEMHRVAEYGIAAHWIYKEGNKDSNKETIGQEDKMAWLNQILDWQQNSNNDEFLDSVKSDLNIFSETVHCFTPTGDIKTLPMGSTPIDFAYLVHSAVGNKMVGARVNGKLVNLDYCLQNGDRVEIVTSQNSKGPSRDWLNIVKSTQAKNKINQWFKTEFKDDNIAKGKDLLALYCKTKSIDQAEILRPEFKEAAQKKYGLKDWDQVMAAIGHGALKEGQVVNRLLEELKKTQKEQITDKEILEEYEEQLHNKEKFVKHKKSGITVYGANDVAVRFSKCCSPVPGDEIIGFITRGRGISIHRTDCVNVISASEEDRNRLIPAEWDGMDSVEKEKNEQYYAEIRIFAHNRPNLVVDTSRIFTENSIDIIAYNYRVSKQNVGTIEVGFKVDNAEELNRLMGKLRNIEGVIDIVRTSS
ncbi:MAG: bifunctional (p)ppGpp synthetase/guanosine-3',5'-bis(diphosphate) 3'-pyrophosphohydrolase [Lachnospiraceae bacterium]|nr:bifunctional (p)ppGpp synthetase/guanosine-3',5'-bis(diphosphate) 3'-pyrophosphohydrolase [Lachnospiraceae bacterium]